MGVSLSANDVSANNDAAQAHARVSFGWATGTSARASWWIGETDNVSPTVAGRNLDRTKLIKLMTEGTPTVNAAADHVSFDSDGQPSIGPPPTPPPAKSSCSGSGGN